MAKTSRDNVRQVRDILRKLEKQGWTVKKTKTGYRCTSGDGEHLLYIHATPSDNRAIKNLIAQLRRMGADF